MMPKMSEHAPLIWGRVKSFEPDVKELKVVYKGNIRKEESMADDLM